MDTKESDPLVTKDGKFVWAKDQPNHNFISLINSIAGHVKDLDAKKFENVLKFIDEFLKQGSGVNHPIGVLSDRDIKREILNGNVILHDPDRDCNGNIQNCSVDITLGPYYYANKGPIPFLNPWEAQHVHDYWGKVKEANIAVDTPDSLVKCNDMGLKPGDRYILLQPGESILGHTREFIGGRNHITTMVKARSSMGRSNVTICRDAGWGDVGFFNRYCLEITNNSTSPIILPVGARIGQIVFFYTGTPDCVYSGKYQTGNTLEELVKNWNPTMLLPKAHLDK